MPTLYMKKLQIKVNDLPKVIQGITGSKYFDIKGYMTLNLYSFHCILSSIMSKEEENILPALVGFSVCSGGKGMALKIKGHAKRSLSSLLKE